MRTSVLAFFCFVSGLLAASAMSVAWFLTYLAGLGELADLRHDESGMLLLAARIVAGAAIAPAAVAVAFWFGARGAVREANGALLGRGLYRAGVLLAVSSVVWGFGGRWSVTGRCDRIKEESKLGPRHLLGRRIGMVRGLARLAKVHDRACSELDAGATMKSEHARGEVFEEIARRHELSEHEQMHVIDLALEELDSAHRQSEVLRALARNMWLTEGARAYILERCREIEVDHFRQEVMDALPTRALDSYAFMGIEYERDGNGPGVKVTKIYANGPAARAGLVPGMRIVAANSAPVRNAEDLEAQTGLLRPAGRLMVRVRSTEGDRDLELIMGTRPGAVVKVEPKPARSVGEQDDK